VRAEFTCHYFGLGLVEGVQLKRNFIFGSKEDRSLVFCLNERTIESIPVMPVALMLGCISAIIGLIVGIFYAVVFGAIFSAIPSTVPSTGLDLSFLRVLFGVGAIILGPILGFIGGLIQGLVYAALYNFLAPRIGGIKVRFKAENQSPQ